MIERRRCCRLMKIMGIKAMVPKPSLCSPANDHPSAEGKIT